MIVGKFRLTPGLAVVVAGAIVAMSAVLLASPGVLLSRQMSWDLLFNLAGAWHLHHGGVANVDFHDPVGQLYFWLTRIGFWLCGPTVQAFVVGEIIVAAAVFIAAAVVSVPRLPPIATMVFTLFVSLIVLMPVNVGDDLTDFTFAMSYNVYGWAAISVLSLILFLPRRRPCEGAWIDAAVGGLLMVAMYYLKISYFAASLGEFALALALYRHVRRTAWLVAGGLVVVNALAPYNWPYLSELANVLAQPDSLTYYAEIERLKGLLQASMVELSIFTLVGGISLGLWLSGRAPLLLPVTMAALVAMGFLLLMLNTQAHGIPLAIVSLFLLYHHMQADTALRRAAPALFVFPLWLTVAAMASLVAYHLAAARKDELVAVDRTNLQGLAVPAGDFPHPVDPIDQDDYVETILEAADLLKRTESGGQGAVLFDQVDPMAFVLGVPPRHGARLWLDPGFPWPQPEKLFAGSNDVLIPKRPVSEDVKREALELYGPYLARHFRHRAESKNWTLLSRALDKGKRPQRRN
jgi:hypothetical protein